MGIIDSAVGTEYTEKKLAAKQKAWSHTLKNAITKIWQVKLDKEIVKGLSSIKHGDRRHIVSGKKANNNNGITV